MGTYRRHVGALLWRNLLYRRRGWLSAILQLLLPPLMIFILVMIKTSLKDNDSFKPKLIPAIYPDESIKPFSFLDYVNAATTPRQCVKKTENIKKKDKSFDFFFQQYSISGINPLDWPVPFLKCDMRKCKKEKDDASPYCSVNILALAPGAEGDDSLVQNFESYIMETYPQIKNFTNYTMIQTFASSVEIDSYVTDPDYGFEGRPKIAVAVILNKKDKEYSYTIRTNSTNFNSHELAGRPVMPTQPNTNRMFATFAKRAKNACRLEGGTSPIGKHDKYCTGQYMYNGALTIQRLIHDWIIDDTGAKAAGSFVAENGVSFVDFPSKEFTRDGFYATVAPYAALLFVLGLLYPVASIIRYVVSEKELRQKELMKMMSVSESALELSWFISSFGFFFVIGILSTIMSSFLYPKANPVALFIFWEMSYLAVVLFSLTVATLFSKTTKATLAGILAFFAGYFLTLTADYATGNSAVIRAVSIHPVAAMSYAVQLIGSLEDAQVGLSRDTLNFTDNPSGYTFRTALGSIFLDIFIWAYYMWYFNRVVPGDYGHALPFYFPFMKSYWCGAKEDDQQIEDLADNDKYTSLPIESVGVTLKEQEKQGMGVHIRGLTKQFGDKTAVDELNLSMYSGQVFALLGHNGAGKTTTISMLTGMLPPTSGNAFINGKNIKSQMQEIREDVGICLQHDCLFPMLTVKEHLQFFGAVKGLYERNSKEEAEVSIETSIKDVALFEKRNSYSKDLSGGMKRKLSLAIAFCGDSKVVFLDEPTSGMDPFSRRYTWNVIRQNRQDRCICLTTHYMEEADLLGDRIAIMSEGGLRCVGSSLFLKKEYGVGYQVTVEKGSDSVEISQQVKSIVMSAVPEALVLSDVSSEITLQLPINASSKFSPMFRDLDEKVGKKEIAMYGVSITTLDEVFLMVARCGEATSNELKLSSSQDVVEVSTEPLKLVPSDPAANGSIKVGTGASYDPDISYRSQEGLEEKELFKIHVQSLFAKRALNFKRDKKAWVCSTICPVIAALFGFIVVSFIAPSRNMVNLELKVADYNANVQDETKRHPFHINESNNFSCQPATCLAKSPGDYSQYCGNLLTLANKSQCSGTSVDHLADELEEADFFPIKNNVSTILEASEDLLEKENNAKLEASMYGALYFTHQYGSMILGNDTALYDETVQNLCVENITDKGYISGTNCSNFSGIGYVVSTNFTAPHASLLYQSVADEMIIRNALSEDYIIKPSIHPLPITKFEGEFAQAEDAFTAWFYLVLSFPFIAGTFATFIVAERESKAKHLQTVAGVKPSAYWLSTFAWDVMNYQLPLWAIVIMIYAFGIESFTTTERDINIGTIVLLFLYGPAAAGFTYMISFFFKSPSNANSFIIVFNFFVGLAGPLVALILRIIYAGTIRDGGTSNLKMIAQIVEWILRFIPSFNFAKGLLFTINIEIFALIDADFDRTVWNTEVMGIEIAYLAVQSVLYVILAMYIDIWSSKPSVGRFFLRKTVDTSHIHHEENDDTDVLEESNRVRDGGANSDVIVMNELKKQFSNGKVAVNGLSLGIPGGQCFGLLGINGAGKTTTMAMLTAEFPPTSGDATLAGFSVTNQPEDTRRRIGYCPQFDAHFMNMTGREHVELYASIKGVPKDLITVAARSKLAEVGLNEYDSDRLSSQYSGGMKRKLSVACATIGDPQIVFLDEPSTGMDPVSRRDMWRVISRMVEKKNGSETDTSVILTTHVMEECEALCPRIGIMAGGKLRCLGSAQHLKSRFGKGFQVELKVGEPVEDDADLEQIGAMLLAHAGISHQNDDVEVGLHKDDIFFTLSEAIDAAKQLSGDDHVSSMITESDPNGYLIFKNAESSVGVPLDELAAFCTTEMRLRNLQSFFTSRYKNSILRERQDTRMRFEVPSDDTTISSLFGSIEENKEILSLQDYGISQTTLEQVFNMHAATAEEKKQGTSD